MYQAEAVTAPVWVPACSLRPQDTVTLKTPFLSSGCNAPPVHLLLSLLNTVNVHIYACRSLHQNSGISIDHAAIPLCTPWEGPNAPHGVIQPTALCQTNQVHPTMVTAHYAC